MLLLDIGNTNVKYFDGKKTARFGVGGFVFPRERFYYINVNPQVQKHLEELPQAVDLAEYFDFHTGYCGLGIDRIAACYSVEEGVVVDAGSAITVDVMQRGVHQGGFIMPGLSSTKETFANISSKLTYDLQQEINLERLPQNTGDALLYATIKPIVLMIEDIAGDLPIVVTGGDGSSLMHYLAKATFRENLVFEGMVKAIKERENAC